MKTITTILVLFFVILLLPTNTKAQVDCPQPTAQADLNVNNVSARIKNAGDLWWDESDARYIVPKVEPASGLPEVAAIFAGGLWVGGFGPGSNLKLAAQTYGSANGQRDYSAGPLNELGTTDSDQCENFDQIWSTNSTDIENHLLDWTDNSTIDGPVPSSILAWPGRGNPHFFDNNGFDLPDQKLAPFVDVNNNGSYDPFDGDYPDINEADHGLWSIFNDAGNIHTQSQGGVLGMEVHLLAYSYNSANDAINDATFYDYTFLNKSVEIIDSAYVAMWVDADLGCHTDDYIGCSPEDDLAFVYNMDAVDGESGCLCPGGVNTYCEEIPLVGIKILNGVTGGKVFGPNGELLNPAIGQSPDTMINLGMSSFMYYLNAGINPPPEPGTTDPSVAQEYYNLMSGTWVDGLPLTNGGDGHNLSGDITSYAFPGNPADGSEWSMCSENMQAGDPRMVIGSGPFKMEQGAINRLSFAVIYQANIAHPCPDISGLKDIAEVVQSFYIGNTISKTHAVTYDRATFKVIPNPFGEQAELIIEGTNQLIEDIRIFSIEGKLLRDYNNIATNRQVIKKGNLPPGIYIYSAITQDQKTYTGKLIIE